MRRAFRERSIGRHVLGVALLFAFLLLVLPLARVWEDAIAGLDLWEPLEYLVRYSPIGPVVYVGFHGSYRASEWLADWFARHDTVAAPRPDEL